MPGRGPALHRFVLAQARNALLRPGADGDYGDRDATEWRSIDWRQMLRTVTVDGHDVNVLDTGGDGEALLWIHGLAANWQCWLLNIPAFRRRHRCIALDLPGFGHSPLPAGGEVSIPGYAALVDRVCDALGVERTTVIGSSMGGFIGAELALRAPARVDRLVLVSAAGLSIEYQRREPVVFAARLGQVGRTHEFAKHPLMVGRPRLRRLIMQSVVRYPEKISAQLSWELVQGAGTDGFLPALEALMSYSFRDRLGEIEAPVLVVWGENDMLVPVGDADRFCRLIGPNARKVIFEDTGHAPMIERPARFNEVLAEFIAGDRTPESDVEGVHA